MNTRIVLGAALVLALFLPAAVHAQCIDSCSWEASCYACHTAGKADCTPCGPPHEPVVIILSPTQRGKITAYAAQSTRGKAALKKGTGRLSRNVHAGVNGKRLPKGHPKIQ